MPRRPYNAPVARQTASGGHGRSRPTPPSIKRLVTTIPPNGDTIAMPSSATAHAVPAERRPPGTAHTSRSGLALDSGCCSSTNGCTDVDHGCGGNSAAHAKRHCGHPSGLCAHPVDLRNGDATGTASASRPMSVCSEECRMSTNSHSWTAHPSRSWASHPEHDSGSSCGHTTTVRTATNAVPHLRTCRTLSAVYSVGSRGGAGNISTSPARRAMHAARRDGAYLWSGWTQCTGNGVGSGEPSGGALVVMSAHPPGAHSGDAPGGLSGGASGGGSRRRHG